MTTTRELSDAVDTVLAATPDAEYPDLCRCLVRCGLLWECPHCRFLGGCDSPRCLGCGWTAEVGAEILDRVG